MAVAAYSVIGLMSGTSLDGLDIALCNFRLESEGWKYEIVQAKTVAYTDEWKQKLSSACQLDALSFQQLHNDYGCYIGQKVNDFLIEYAVQADFVASHGHTVFHQPEKRLTVQIGNGSCIASKCKLPVVCDFRIMDVALAGQGAPLVPIGDQLLFKQFDFCLNLGGFANVSYDFKGKRLAYDICPVNIVLNEICEQIGLAYDDGGKLAKEGMISHYVLTELNQSGFYKMTPNTPKSLGKEWVVTHVHPVLQLYEIAEQDVLRTFCEHIAIQIGKALNDKPKGKLLITGGGAYNLFLLECIKKHCIHELIIPDKKTIEFKEALIFAFLGVLRMRNEINCLKSVTGAFADSCCGVVHHYIRL